jgi:hypothetical protein
MTRRIVLLALAAAALAACSTSSDETWVGKNAGVTVDSFPEQHAQPPAGGR